MRDILSMADAFYKAASDQLDSLDKEIEEDPSSLDDFERVWRKFESVFSFLAKIPSPIGNPFAAAMLGKDISDFYERGYNKKTLESFIGHVLDAVPLAGYAKLATKLGRVPTMVETAAVEIPRVARPTFVKTMGWFSRHIKSKAVVNGIAYGAYAGTDYCIDTLKTKGSVWVIDSILRTEPKVNSSFSEIKKDPSKREDAPSDSEIALMREMSKVWVNSRSSYIQTELNKISSSIDDFLYNYSQDWSESQGWSKDWSEGVVSYEPSHDYEKDSKDTKDSEAAKFPIRIPESAWMEKLQTGEVDITSLETRLRQIDSQKLDPETTKILKNRATEAYQKAVQKRKSK